MKRGIVYACSHQAWVGETRRSAESCRLHMPALAREIFMSRDLLDRHADWVEPLFTRAVGLDRVSHMGRPRFDAMAQTGLDEAIFIDGDTLFLAPVIELFGVLKQFDLALMPAPQFFHSQAIAGGIYDLLPPVSTALPEWNGGVIVARVTERFRRFADSWSEMFRMCVERGYHMDQASLRSALPASDLRFVNLPSLYNFRANVTQTVKGSVKVLHAHGDLEEIAETINQRTDSRIYHPNPDLVHGFYPRDLSATPP